MNIAQALSIYPGTQSNFSESKKYQEDKYYSESKVYNNSTSIHPSKCNNTPIYSSKLSLEYFDELPKVETIKNRKNQFKDFVFFLMHGLEANPFDMRYIRAAILMNLPGAKIFMIQNNYTLTNDNLKEQGKRFGLEVKYFLTVNNLNRNFLIYSISFKKPFSFKIS